jgi:hypothetical protein
VAAGAEIAADSALKDDPPRPSRVSSTWEISFQLTIGLAQA